MSDEGQAEGQDVEQTTEAPQESGPPEWLGPIQERMEAMSAQQAQIAEQFSQALTPEEEEYELPIYDDDTGELTEDGVRAVVNDYVREQIDAQMAPREAALLKDQRDDAFEALKDEYPELQDQGVVGPLIDAAFRRAQAIDPALIERPEFVDLIEDAFIRSKYNEVRSAQQTDGQREVVLESASGASRAQKAPKEVDWQQRVIDAAKASNPRI